MTRDSLQTYLEAKKIPSQWYNIGGMGLTDQRTVLQEENGKWIVFYSERGIRFDLSSYDNEADACKELLERIKELIKDYQ